MLVVYIQYKYIHYNLFIGIGYILPTIGEYMLAEFIYCYWIYSANNWGIYVNWRVSVRPSGAGLQNVLFSRNIHILENAHSATLCPKGAQTPILLTAPNGWQNISNTRIYPIPIYINSTDIYSPIVGSIYPIQIYKSKCIFPNPASRRAHRHPPTDIYHPIVGSIYPIQKYK